MKIASFITAVVFLLLALIILVRTPDKASHVVILCTLAIFNYISYAVYNLEDKITKNK